MTTPLTITKELLSIMLPLSVSMPIFICGLVFFIIDVLIILILTFLWWRKKKIRKNEERQMLNKQGTSYIPLIKPNPLSSPPTTPIRVQNDIQEFEIPQLNADNVIRRQKGRTLYDLNDFNNETKSISNKIMSCGLEPVQYIPTTTTHQQQRSSESKPKLSFEFYYDFRTTQLKVTLYSLKNIYR